MAELDVQSRDYVAASLMGTTAVSVIQSALMRLSIQRGSYWRDPSMGSELYRLLRVKDVTRLVRDAKRYAEQALQPLVDSKRVRAVKVLVHQDRPMWLRLQVDLTLLDQRVQRVTHFVPVGG